MMKQTFDWRLLPNPAAFYAGQLSKFRPARGRWAKGICPFHNDHNPSLSVNVESGAYNCFSCGAHGGDVVDFYRLRYGVDFKTAAKALGAMGDAPANYQPAKADRARLLIRAFRRWEVLYLTRVCADLQLIWRFIAACKDMDEAVQLSRLYHFLPTLEMHFEILCFGDDETKYRLFREVKNETI